MSSPSLKRSVVSFEHANILQTRFSSSGSGALVNAGNANLELGFGSGGLSGAFHKDVGAEASGGSLLKKALLEQNSAFGTHVLEGSCAVVEIGAGAGKLKISNPSSLIKGNGAKFIIHAVGPDCGSGKYKTNPRARADALENAYKAAFDAAIFKGVTEIAIPALSIGIFGFPEAEAAGIIAKVMYDYKDRFSSIKLCAFDPAQPATAPTILGLVEAEFNKLETATRRASSGIASGAVIATAPVAIAPTPSRIPAATPPTRLSVKSSSILEELNKTLGSALLAQSTPSRGAGSSATPLQNFFSERGGNHFDWWAFPLNSYAANDKSGKYRVGDREITELLQNADFVTSYQGFIALYFESMGWDIANSKPNGLPIPAKLHDVRFAKCLSSMNLFGQRDFRDSADAFLAHSKSTRKAPLFENSGNAWALEDYDSTVARAISDPSRYPDRHTDHRGATVVDGFAEFKKTTTRTTTAAASFRAPDLAGASFAADPMPHLPGFVHYGSGEELAPQPTATRHAVATSEEESTRRLLVLTAYNAARKDGKKLATQADIKQLIAGVALFEEDNLSSNPNLDRIYFHEGHRKAKGNSFFANQTEIDDFFKALRNLGISPKQQSAAAVPATVTEAASVPTHFAASSPKTPAAPQPAFEDAAIRLAGLQAYHASTKRKLSGDKATALIDALKYLLMPTKSRGADDFVDAAVREKLFKNKKEFGKFLTNLSGCGLEISESDKLVASYEKRTKAGARVVPLDTTPFGSVAATGAVAVKPRKGPQHGPS